MGLFSRSTKVSPVVAAVTTAPVFDAGTTAVDDIAGDYTLDITHTRIGFSADPADWAIVRELPAFLTALGEHRNWDRPVPV